MERLLDHDDTNVKVRDRSETSTQSVAKLTLLFFIFNFSDGEKATSWIIKEVKKANPSEKPSALF